MKFYMSQRKNEVWVSHTKHLGTRTTIYIGKDKGETKNKIKAWMKKQKINHHIEIYQDDSSSKVKELENLLQEKEAFIKKQNETIAHLREQLANLMLNDTPIVQNDTIVVQAIDTPVVQVSDTTDVQNDTTTVQDANTTVVQKNIEGFKFMGLNINKMKNEWHACKKARFEGKVKNIKIYIVRGGEFNEEKARQKIEKYFKKNPELVEPSGVEL